ncbi:MAG: hypothetical protein ACOZQL_20360 [Myxococcota bacterium]
MMWLAALAELSRDTFQRASTSPFSVAVDEDRRLAELLDDVPAIDEAMDGGPAL